MGVEICIMYAHVCLNLSQPYDMQIVHSQFHDTDRS